MEKTDNGNYHYTSQRETIKEVEQQVKINGNKTVFAYTPSQSGEFEIRVSRPGSGSYVFKNFYAYRFGDTQTTAFEVNRSGNVNVQFDKETYKVGDQAKVLLTTPFEGKLLVTVERDKVMEHFYVNTDKKAKEVTFEVTAAMIPNIYVSATLIRPMSDRSVPLNVAHGYAPATVEEPANNMAVKIETKESTRSKTKHNIRVTTAPNATVSIAVVDEGILQLKNYKTPSPHGFFYQKRALQVESFDIYPFIFPEVMAGSLLSGGGDAYNLGKRVNPFTSKRVKLVSKWSGLLKANGSGVVDYAVNIPQFSGDLRVMAVAFKGSQFGSGDAHVKVADPIVISTGLPRFTSPGDSLLVPVTFTNTTAQSVSGNLSLTTDGALKLSGSGASTVTIPAGGEHRALYTLVAQPNPGEAKVTASIKALNETFTEELEISVRPPASLEKRSGSGTLNAGQSQPIDLLSNFMPASFDGKLVVSRSPLIEFGNDFEYLVEYPYGCAEQTISVAFPQIYYSDLMKSIGATPRTATLPNSNNANYNVQSAIRKIEGMQLYNGAIAYWEGATEQQENWWTSVYALHFFYEARKAGYEVKQTAYNQLQDYVQKQVGRKETFSYLYRDAAGKQVKKPIARKEIPYSLYVLALVGKPSVSMMNYYKSNTNLLSLDGKYMLASAYSLAGGKDKFAQVLPASFSGETSVNIMDESFYSPLRDVALSLYTLVEADPNNKQIGTLTRQLIELV